MKGAFGASRKEELCEGQVVEGEIGVGSPALLVISLAALRSLELSEVPVVPCIRTEMCAALFCFCW